MDVYEEFSEETVCKICNQANGLDKDPIIETEQIQAHFYCLLFSSGLGQKGKEDDGIKGFLFSDIRKELKRGARLKCVYCRKKGATVGCAEPKCKKSYHLPCGDHHDSLQQFFDQFKSFCKEHRPSQRVERHGGKKSEKKDNICIICQEKILRKATMKTLWSPCCQEFFHRKCIQDLAYSSGSYHFRCPKCRSDTDFRSEMQRLGVNVPVQDASWENSQNFQDIDESPVRLCHAKICFCSHEEGRAFHKEDGLWEVLLCRGCGSRGIHAKCGGLEDFPEAVWDCYNCRDVMKDSKPELLPSMDKLFSAQEKSKPEPEPRPNRLFEALLATLPHLQSMEESLQSSDKQDGYNHRELSITPVLVPSQSTIGVHPTYQPPSLSLATLLPSARPNLGSPDLSLVPSGSNLAPICSTLASSSVHAQASSSTRPQLIPPRPSNGFSGLETGLSSEKKVVSKRISVSKPGVKDLYDYSLEDIIRSRLYDGSGESGTTISIVDRVNGTAATAPNQWNGGGAQFSAGGSVSITGVVKSQLGGKNGGVSRNGFSKGSPVFRVAAGPAGDVGGNQRKMTEYFLNRKN